MVKLFEAATEQFLGSPECYMWNLPTLMVCLAPLRAKSMGVGMRAGIAETKQPSP
jgi:hypothetical protein